MRIRSLAAAGLLCGAAAAQAAISVGTASFSYSQSFDSLATSGSSNAWVNDTTLTGWSLFTGAGSAITTYRADASASNTSGAFYSFGSGGERALGGTGSGGTYFGSPATGAVAGYIAASFTNNTGLKITSVTLDFDGEQWRNGGNTTAHTTVLEYGFGATFGTVSSWTAAGSAFNFSSKVNTATAAMVDGNVAGLTDGVGGTIATDWATGSTLWVRWIERNETGNDHGLAIDNFSLSVTAVPEPGALALLLAGLGVIGTVARRRA